MRRMDHDGKINLLGELDLLAQIFVFQGGLFVIAELADGDDLSFAAKCGSTSMTASASLLASFGLSATQQ